MKSYVPLHYVPIEDDGYHLQITGGVNGRCVRLVVDSGASRTIFDSHRIHHLTDTSRQTVANLQAHGLGEEISSYLLQADSLQIGDTLIHQYTCVMVDLQPLNALFQAIDAPGIHGILGGDLLVTLNGIINYKKNTLKLAGKNYPLKRLSFDDGSFHLMVQVNLNRLPAGLLLDTGASKTVFDSNALHQFYDFDPANLIPNDKPSAGIHIETSEHSTLLLNDITFGYLSVPETETLLLDLSNINYTYSLLNLPPVDGIVGNDMLDRLEAVINYKKKILRIKD